VIEIDLIGTFNMSKAAFEALKAAKESIIINISATLHHRGTPWQGKSAQIFSLQSCAHFIPPLVHPGAAKAGVDAMTKMLACEWGDFGIRVVALAPGMTKNTEASVRLASLMPENSTEGVCYHLQCSNSYLLLNYVTDSFKATWQQERVGPCLLFLGLSIWELHYGPSHRLRWWTGVIRSKDGISRGYCRNE